MSRCTLLIFFMSLATRDQHNQLTSCLSALHAWFLHSLDVSSPTSKPTYLLGVSVSPFATQRPPASQIRALRLTTVHDINVRLLVYIVSGSGGDCNRSRDSSASRAPAAVRALWIFRVSCAVPLRVPAVHADSARRRAQPSTSLPQRLRRARDRRLSDVVRTCTQSPHHQ